MTRNHGLKPLRRRGMTLIEMLVATTITLIMMGLVAQLFSVFGQGVTGSRSVIELTDQMRSAGWQLRQDLGGVTTTMLPPRRPEANEGYFELLEGPATDRNIPGPLDPNTTNTLATGDATNLTGDCDDALLFTTRSPGAPFVGRFIKGTIQSPVAEVAWFCRPAAQQLATGPTLFTLYRRQLLVMDYVGANASSAFFPATGGNYVDFAMVGSRWDTFYNGNGTTFYGFDLSCRLTPGKNGPILVPNSLGDLTKRENRFGHYPNLSETNLPAAGFPFATVSIAPLANARTGEDVVLNNVLAFDVRVFDPAAPVLVPNSGGAVTAGDPGAINGVNPQVGGVGAYVDLFWNRVPNGGAAIPSGSPFPPLNQSITAFQSAGVMVSAAPKNVVMSGTLALPSLPVSGPTTQDNKTSPGKPGAANVAIYDTWSTHYEANGINENGNTDPHNNNQPLIDEGTNGLDDNGDGLVDDPAEAETSPPYPVPLRGIEVRLRCYEPSSRQVRQVTIRHTFVPY